MHCFEWPRGLFHAAFLLAFVAQTNAYADERIGQGPYARFETFGYTEPLSIKNYAGEFRGDLKRGSDGVLFYKAELGWQIDGWNIALTRRLHWTVKASRDFIELRSLEKNDRPLPPGRAFDIDLDVAGFEGLGISVSHGLNIGALELVPRLSIVDGSRLIDGTLGGSVLATSNDTFDASIDLDYFYSHDEKIFGRRVTRPDGAGLLFDLDGTWLISQDWRASFSIDDLISYVFWESAPFTKAAGSTSNSSTGSGIASSIPLISGIESFDDFTQRLKPHGEAEVAWLQNDAEYSLGAYIIPTNLVPFVSYGSKLGGVNGRFRLMPTVDAFGIDLGWNHWRFSWAADSVALDRTRFMHLDISYTTFFGK